MPRLFLFDGTALAYRSHYALANLRTSGGLPSGATFGFAQALRRVLDAEHPERVAVAFDAPGSTFRHERFATYKATRQKAPEELLAQYEWIREIVRALGIPTYEVSGFEADDVIGTLACQAVEAGYEVRIVTADKDFMQLVGPRIQIHNIFKRDIELVVEGVDAVREKFGTSPDHVIDVLAIMGDSSDNVPGVKGIGEKGAIALIQRFGSVEGILQNLTALEPKLREKVERDREQLLLSRELVKIRCDLPLNPSFAELGPPSPDTRALARIFGRLEFTSLKVEHAPRTELPERRYQVVRTREELEALIAKLRVQATFAIDAETTSPRPLEGKLVGLSFAFAEGEAFYVPFNASPPVLPGGSREVLETLRALLCDPALSRVGHNTKHDWLALAAHGVRMPPAVFDAMVASYCVAGASRSHGLESLALAYFDLKKTKASDLTGKGAKQISLLDAPFEQVGEASCEDADLTWRLFGVLSKELEEQGAAELFRSLEMPLVPVLAAMEERGVRVDVEHLARLSAEFESEIATAVRDVQRLAGAEFNVNSPKALGAVLFEKLRIQDLAGVKRPKKTKTGWATDQETLHLSYGEVEIVKRLLEYREVQKLKSTYLDALPRYVNPRTGRVHCSLSQVTAATGRLASSEPNLQNIPVRGERGRRLREAFVPPEADARGEWLLLSADYSQVELRILAHFAGDEVMKAAFAAGEDIHRRTAAVVFGARQEEVTREMRSRAKAVNFGVMYGMGPARLARETNLSMAEAREFIERYFRSFPAVARWREDVLQRARQQGYVETLLGRRRTIPELRSDNSRLRAQAENTAINTPVQGSAADIIKRAMIDIERKLAGSKLAARMLLQVHDELLFELPAVELEKTGELVRGCMEGAVSLSLPLKVDLGSGRNWLEAH